MPLSAVLHAEFQAAGIANLRVGLLVAYGLSRAAWAVCVASPGPIGWVVAGVLALLAFLAALIGGLVGVGDAGSPSDLEGAPADIHQPATRPSAPTCCPCGVDGCELSAEPEPDEGPVIR